MVFCCLLSFFLGIILGLFGLNKCVSQPCEPKIAQSYEEFATCANFFFIFSQKTTPNMHKTVFFAICPLFFALSRLAIGEHRSLSRMPSGFVH